MTEKDRGANNTVKGGGGGQQSGGQQSETWDQQRKESGNLAGNKDRSAKQPDRNKS